MRAIRLTVELIAQLISRIYALTVPSLFFSGGSQTGKTTAMKSLIQAQLSAGLPGFIFDPHGALFQDLAAFAMTLPASIRKRIRFINFAEGLISVVDTLRWETAAELSTVVERTMNCIKAAFGDNIEVETQPLIDEYLRASTTAIALTRRTLPEAVAALDPDDPLYDRIVAEVMEIDASLGQKIAAIASMSLREYLANVAPARRRLDSVLRENTFVRDMLSHEASFNATDEIAKGTIWIVTLQQFNREGKKVLRDIDQRTLLCLFITSIIDAAYGFLNGPKRCRFILWIDELHLARGAFHSIQRALSELAKFGVTVAAGDQSVYNFPDHAENSLLQSFLANSHYVFNFRSTSEVDSRVFSFLPFLVTYCATRIKNVIRTRSQYIVGHQLRTLVSRSYSWMCGIASATNTTRNASLGRGNSTQLTETASIARHHGRSVGAGRAKSSSTLSSDGVANGQQFKDIVDGVILSTRGSNHSDSHGEGESANVSWTRSIMDAISRSLGRSIGVHESETNGVAAGVSSTNSKQSSGSVTYSPTLVPMYAWNEQVSSITYYQPSELQLEMQQLQARLPVGHCTSVAAGLGAAHLIFPQPVDVADVVGAEIHVRLERFVSELQQDSAYVSVGNIDGAYYRLLERRRCEDELDDDPGNDPFSK